MRCWLAFPSKLISTSHTLNCPSLRLTNHFLARALSPLHPRPPSFLSKLCLSATVFLLSYLLWSQLVCRSGFLGYSFPNNPSLPPCMYANIRFFMPVKKMVSRYKYNSWHYVIRITGHDNHSNSTYPLSHCDKHCRRSTFWFNKYGWFEVCCNWA